MKKGDIVEYKSRKAKIIGVSLKAGKIKYKLRLYDKFHTIIYNIDQKEVMKIIDKTVN